MARAGGVAALIALVGLLAAWALVETLAGEPGETTVPVVETIGFAVSTPAAIVFTTYLTDVFEFERYYSDRDRAGIVGDFVLAVLTAATVGLVAVTAVGGLTGSPMVTFVVGSIVTFTAAFAAFLLRTRAFVDWEPPEAD